MIRQAISCDICSSEKQQTNHWFVAYERNGELRLTRWQGRATRRDGVKHLCGQKCVHRLLDEFMASNPAQVGPTMGPAVPASIPQPVETVEEIADSARLIEPPCSPAKPESQPNPASVVPMRPEAVRTLQKNPQTTAWERERALQQAGKGGSPVSSTRLFGR